jgi:hypothetical protein
MKRITRASAKYKSFSVNTQSKSEYPEYEQLTTVKDEDFEETMGNVEEL